MNESQIIEMALQRQFARESVPECPRGPWAPTTIAPLPHRPQSKNFAFACAVLVILLGAGIATEASGVLRAGYAHLFNQGSSTPLPPLIHKADRLTIAQAQQHMPFTIVAPVGLPTQTIFQYAHVLSEQPKASVSLVYQTQIAGRYYRILIGETNAISGPPVAHFEGIVQEKNGKTRRETWTLPLLRWKHGNVIMEMLPQGLPATVTDRIVRENTL
ncbi:MAG: hypothetical protein M3N19_11285 [Candidatus Eremiobacteraeota bacterium]|nr:hypothetical protein [Candidatus Eremiobacteraeota bacterium]